MIEIQTDTLENIQYYGKYSLWLICGIIFFLIICGIFFYNLYNEDNE
jgi:Na+/melibiose symporter-like transporter